MIYIIPFFISVFSTLFQFFRFEKMSRFSNFILLLGLILIAGLRYDTGLDFWNYVEMYEEAKYNKFYEIHSCEPLFGLMLQLFSDLTFDHFTFFLALISISIKFYAMNKYSFIPSISILIYFSKYFVLSDMGQIRQGIALGVLFFTIPHILQRNFIKFSILVLISTLLHSTAILFTIAYFLPSLSMSKSKYIFLSLFSFVFIFFDSSILISKLYFIFPDLLKEKFLFYTQFHIVESGFYLKTIFLKIPVLIVGFLFFDKMKKNPMHLLLFNIYFVGFILSLFFINFYQLCIRGSLYFTHFEILLIPIFIYYLKPQFTNIIVYLAIILYSSFSFSKIYFSEWSKYLLPYYSIYEKEKLLYQRSRAEF